MTTVTTQSGPYPPHYQALGETPSVLPDVPACVFLLLFFLVGGAWHMQIFVRNRKAGRKFLLNVMIFVFCNIRILAFILRMAWAKHLLNISLAIAAQIFVYAGVVLLYVANLILTQRIIRAQLPHIGWTKPATIAFPFVIGVIILTIIMVISAVIQSFYTLDVAIQSRDRSIELWGQAWFIIVSVLPSILLGISKLTRRIQSSTRSPDDLGSGSLRTKEIIVLSSSLVLTLGACFRATSVFHNPVPVPYWSTHPGNHNGYGSVPTPWFLSKAIFYIFTFLPELFVVYLFASLRIDKRFHVPNGARGPYSYGGQYDTVDRQSLPDPETKSRFSMYAKAPNSPRRMTIGSRRATLASTMTPYRQSGMLSSSTLVGTRSNTPTLNAMRISKRICEAGCACDTCTWGINDVHAINQHDRSVTPSSPHFRAKSQASSDTYSQSGISDTTKGKSSDESIYELDAMGSPKGTIVRERSGTGLVHPAFRIETTSPSPIEQDGPVSGSHVSRERIKSWRTGDEEMGFPNTADEEQEEDQDWFADYDPGRVEQKTLSVDLEQLLGSGQFKKKRPVSQLLGGVKKERPASNMSVATAKTFVSAKEELEDE